MLTCVVYLSDAVVHPGFIFMGEGLQGSLQGRKKFDTNIAQIRINT